MGTTFASQILKYANWGRIPAPEQHVLAVQPGDVKTIRELPQPLLGYGLGRSYGDSCLNSAGILLSTRSLNAVRRFDRESGVIRAEAGVTLQTLLELCEQKNADGSHWFLPVTPGTQYVTLAGAVANDVHGKNHLHHGSFACHVLSLTLHRSSGDVVECSSTENTELFHATIGGMGLTGFISEVELQLQRVPGLALEVETQRFSHIADYTALAAESAEWEYTVAWIDCLAPAAELGRGLFSRARHVVGGAPPARTRKLAVPFTVPFCLLNRFTLKCLNWLYLNQVRSSGWLRSAPHYRSFFYPLDRIANWNRLYGPRGFYQYQCALPAENAMIGIGQLLKVIAASGQGSFLAVLKSFGPAHSGGMLSFPQEGLTLALDFPNKGQKTLALLAELDTITLAHHGRIYPAKDGRIPAAIYRAMMPQWSEFSSYTDDGFSSDFWQRVQSQEKN